jgi:hypothetical protein
MHPHMNLPPNQCSSPPPPLPFIRLPPPCALPITLPPHPSHPLRLPLSNFPHYSHHISNFSKFSALLRPPTRPFPSFLDLAISHLQHSSLAFYPAPPLPPRLNPFMPPSSTPFAHPTSLIPSYYDPPVIHNSSPNRHCSNGKTSLNWSTPALMAQWRRIRVRGSPWSVPIAHVKLLCSSE